MHTFSRDRTNPVSRHERYTSATTEIVEAAIVPEDGLAAAAAAVPPGELLLLLLHCGWADQGA